MNAARSPLTKVKSIVNIPKEIKTILFFLYKKIIIKRKKYFDKKLPKMSSSPNNPLIL